jgi:hypothetical protein
MCQPAGPRCRSTFGGDVDDSLRKGLRGFLWQIVPDAARDIRCAYLPENFGA